MSKILRYITLRWHPDYIAFWLFWGCVSSFVPVLLTIASFCQIYVKDDHSISFTSISFWANIALAYLISGMFVWMGYVINGPGSKDWKERQREHVSKVSGRFNYYLEKTFFWWNKE